MGITKILCYYWLTVLIQIIESESLNRCFEQWVRSIIPLSKVIKRNYEKKLLLTLAKNHCVKR